MHTAWTLRHVPQQPVVSDAMHCRWAMKWRPILRREIFAQTRQTNERHDRRLWSNHRLTSPWTWCAVYNNIMANDLHCIECNCDDAQRGINIVCPIDRHTPGPQQRYRFLLRPSRGNIATSTTRSSRHWKTSVWELSRILEHLIYLSANQCNFRFDLFFSFSFSFASYQTCWWRRVDDLPNYRPPLVTDSTPYGRSTRKRRIVC